MYVISSLFPVDRRLVFDFLVRLFDRDEFKEKACAHYCDESDKVNDPMLVDEFGNNKLVYSYFDFDNVDEEKLDD